MRGSKKPMTEEDVQRRAELEAEIRRKYLLFFLKMNPVQERFIRVRNSRGRMPRRRILEAGNKLGKGQPVDELVLTPGGYVRIGSLKIGDGIFTASGAMTTVTGIFNRGVRECYEFVFDDESTVYADGDHLWKVFLPHGRFRDGKSNLMTTDELIAYRAQHKRYGRHIAVPVTEPVLFPERDLPVDPYTLGVLLGDGHIGSATVSTKDGFILDELGRRGIGARDIDGVSYHLSENGFRHVRNSESGQYEAGGLPQKLRELGLSGKRSWEKHIPPEYLFSSPAQRLDLLRGLMDTDGSITGDGKPTMEYCTTSRELMLGVRVLVTTLGGKCKVRERVTHYTHREQRKAGRLSYRVKVMMNTCPFLLPRKAERFRPKKRTAMRIIRDIRPAGEKECVCISVADESQLYLTRDCIVTHNTYIGIAEDIAHMMGYRPWLKESDPDFRLDVKVPNQGLVAGETIMHSIAEKIEPTFRLLIPDFCKPVFKAGPTGTSIRVTLTYDVDGRKCGSVAHFRSYDQRPETFEGIDYDWEHWDEPPPEATLQAAERGKVVTNAPSWFTMTPLKEPYILDKFSRKAAHVF